MHPCLTSPVTDLRSTSRLYKPYDDVPKWHTKSLVAAIKRRHKVQT